MQRLHLHRWCVLKGAPCAHDRHLYLCLCGCEARLRSHVRALIATLANPIRHAFRVTFRCTTWLLCCSDGSFWSVPVRVHLTAPYGSVITVPLVLLSVADLCVGCRRRALPRDVIWNCRYFGLDSTLNARMVSFLEILHYFRGFTLFTPPPCYFKGTSARLFFYFESHCSFKWRALTAFRMSWSAPCCCA